MLLDIFTGPSKEVKPPSAEYAFAMALGAMYYPDIDERLDNIREDVEDWDESSEKEDYMNEWYGSLTEELLLIDMGVGRKDGKQAAIDLLNNSWEIIDVDTFTNGLLFLKDEGHRSVLDFFQELVKTGWNETNIDENITNHEKDIQERGMNYTASERNVFEEFKKGFIAYLGQREALDVTDIAAWDYARYIQVVRLGYLAGYIDEKSGWEKILEIVPAVREHYSTWEQYASGFLVGRSWWAAYNKEFTSPDDNYAAITQKLLKDQVSPWMYFILKTQNNKTA